MATPKKLVHWALDASLSELGSPFSEASSSESCSSTSTLQYVNSQLIAHGFVHDIALSLEGLAKGDADRVVKCILGMLSQRVEDMSRTEDLTTKFRTLSYDHERLTSMYKSASDKAANAEREMNLHKSRMTAAVKSLQSSENAHKHTTAELQRTRTTLHALRATHQTEIKKVEKEKDRMVERWIKISDSQLKIGSIGAGLTCANLDVVEASDVQVRGKGQGFLDVALEQAESARKELFEQNRKLRGLLLSAANELQSVLHAARTAGATEHSDEPTPFSFTALFPNSPAEAAGNTLNSLFNSLREAVSQKAELKAAPCPCSHKESSSWSKPQDNTEIERLQLVIDKLRTELDQAQKQAAAAAAQTQELFDRFAEDQRIASHAASEISIDLMIAPAQDEEKQRLEARFKELEDERRKFTEAAVRLGREKAALESERLKLLEERRSWEVEMMLAELPPTPASAAGPSALPAVPPSMLPKGSPRRSPRKFKAKAASPRKTRVSRRSSGLGAIILSPKKKIVPAYETEVIPSNIPAIPPSPTRPPPEFKTSIVVPSALPHALFTSTFVLPPPSPAAALPSREGGGTPLPPIPPLPKLEIPPPSDDSQDDDSMDITPEPVSSAISSSASSIASSSSAPSNSAHAPSAPPILCTPIVRPFPMAKPFAQRMIHAYSPVKPSPLSRILMLADSPESPEDPKLDPLAEVDEDAVDVSHIPAHAQTIAKELVRSLAEELGVSEDDDIPLREKQLVPTAKAEPAPAPPASRKHPADIGAKDKGKARTEGATAPQQTTSRARAGATLENENVKRAKLSSGSAGSSGGKSATGSAKDAKKPAASKSAGATSSRTRPGAGGVGRGAPPKSSAPPKGGARRVPIGSAEAAPVPSWRG